MGTVIEIRLSHFPPLSKSYMYLSGGCVARVERRSGTAAESVVSVTEEWSEQATAVGRQSSSVVIGLDKEVV